MNLSPGSLRTSAQYLRLIAKPETDLETLAPYLLEDRPAVLMTIAEELEALALEREPKRLGIGWRLWLRRNR